MIRRQAEIDNQDTTLFDATMKLLNRPLTSVQNIEWIISTGHDFALASLMKSNSLDGPLVRHWLDDPQSSAE